MRQDEWNELIEKCKKEGIKVKLIDPDSLADYAGMNDLAAQAMGYHRMKMPPKTIYIDKSLPKDVQIRTLRHEMLERQIMLQGVDYWPAHREALRREKK